MATKVSPNASKYADATAQKVASAEKLLAGDKKSPKDTAASPRSRSSMGPPGSSMGQSLSSSDMLPVNPALLCTSSSDPTKTLPSAETTNENKKVRNRKLLYHQPALPPRHKTSVEKSSDSPYGKTRNSDDYKRKSYSDEYKRRKFNEREQEKEEAELTGGGVSPEFYMVAVGLGFVLMLILIVVTVMIFFEKEEEDQMKTTLSYSYEKQYRQAVYMSDNLECSLIMKKMSMVSDSFRSTLIAAMMCMSLLEPHSAAADSGISMTLYYRQTRARMAISVVKPKYNSSCISVEDNSKCSIESYPTVRIGYTNLAGNIKDSKLYSQILFDVADEYFSEEKYQQYFQQLFWDLDIEIPPYANSTKNYELGRIFRVSKRYEQFRKIAKLPSLGSSRTIQTDGEMIRSTIESFVNVSEARSAGSPNTYEIRLDLDHEGKTTYVNLIIPRGQTMSIFAVFVIKVVYELHRKKPLAEAEMYGYILKSQKLAYQLFSHTKGWSDKNHDITKSFLSPASFESAVLHLQKEKLFRRSVTDRNIRRNPDRVASIVAWQPGQRDILGIINMALPRLFNSSYGKSKAKQADFSGFELNGKHSIPFTSACSVVSVFMKGKLSNGTGSFKAGFDKPHLIVTSSGSVRTVEGVAITVLRKLILGESPGKAAHSPGAYYDTRDGTFRCEIERGKDKEKDTDLFGDVSEYFSSTCIEPSSSDFMAKDRIVMIAEQGKKAGSYLQAALNDRTKQHNYATGH